MYSLASLFLPIVFKEKNIPGFWTGMVFSMYSIAVVIVSPFIGTLINKVGFANLISIGLVLMGISIIPIGTLKDIGDDNTTLLVGIILRAMQGTAAAAINTTCFSLAANKYADQTEFVVGMMEGMSGVGLVLGLLGGSIIYETLGYKAVFIDFGSLLFVLAIISRLLFKCLDDR